MKLVLGLAGLGGKPYGLKNRALTKSQAQEIMRHAYENGIRYVDSAEAYGRATEWAQEFPFIVYQKTDKLGYKDNDHLIHLHHHWCAFQDSRYTGASVYAEDLEAAYTAFPLVQVEWNILRQTDIGSAPKTARTIARSVLLQGVLAGAEAPLTGLRGFVKKAEKCAKALGVDLGTFALRAAIENPYINQVVIGPQYLSELNYCLEIEAMPKIGACDYLKDLADCPFRLTDPRTWP